MNTSPSRTLQAVVPTALAERMEHRARDEHISLSAWIRRALARSLDEPTTTEGTAQ